MYCDGLAWCSSMMPHPPVDTYCICHDLDGQYDCTEEECFDKMNWLI